MKELAEKFIGKECLVYTIASDTNSVNGTVKEVTDNGILIEYKGELQAVNLEYVTRIKEWPKNSKGKKKSVVFLKDICPLESIQIQSNGIFKIPLLL